MNLEQNKLLTLWRVLFTEKDYAWQQLRAFVANNGDKKSAALLAYFEPFAPSFTSNRKSKISLIDVYKAVYKGATPPSENLRRDRIYHAVSELFALTERFILSKAADYDPLVPPYQVLLQLYTHHNLQEHFLDYWRILQQKQTAAPVSERSVFESFYLAEAYTQFQLFNNRAEAGKALHAVDDALHSLVFTNVLRYSVSVFTMQNQMNEQFRNVFLPMTLAYIEENWTWAQQYPMLYVNYEIYKLLENPDKARLKRDLLIFIQNRTCRRHRF